MQNANRMSDATVYCRIFDTHTHTHTHAGFIQINETSDTALSRTHITQIFMLFIIISVSLTLCLNDSHMSLLRFHFDDYCLYLIFFYSFILQPKLTRNKSQ